MKGSSSTAKRAGGNTKQPQGHGMAAAGPSIDTDVVVDVDSQYGDHDQPGSCGSNLATEAESGDGVF